MPYTSTADIRIHYQRKGNGCPVVFLGGVGGDLRSKPNVFDSPLAERFDILSFERHGGPGTGTQESTAGSQPGAVLLHGRWRGRFFLPDP